MLHPSCPIGHLCQLHQGVSHNTRTNPQRLSESLSGTAGDAQPQWSHSQIVGYRGDRFSIGCSHSGQRPVKSGCPFSSANCSDGVSHTRGIEINSPSYRGCSLITWGLPTLKQCCPSQRSPNRAAPQHNTTGKPRQGTSDRLEPSLTRAH